jgi:cell migration-inducing and hyaluronan-binding protein
VSPPSLGGLRIDGALVFAPRSLHLRSKWVMVHGRLQIGTPARPHPAKATITLTETNPNADTMGMGPKVLGVMGPGVIDLHGRSKSSWVRLAANAPRGARTLTLDRAVTWRPGDRIVVASTDFEPTQSETVRVTRVVGRTVSIAAPLKYPHWGTLQRYGNRVLDERAEVGLLSRDIVIQGDAAGERAGFGAQVMAMPGSTVRVRGVTLYRMGKRGTLRRYPIHFHMMGNARGSYLRDSSIDHSFNRGITVHGTHNLVVAGNVIHDVVGHAVFLEDGIERGSAFVGNLSVRTIRPKKEQRLLPSDTDGNGPAAFWITNPANIFRGNVASGSDGIGFWIALPEHPTGLSKTDKVWPRRTPLREFVGNRAHSNGSDGLHADNGPGADGTPGTTFWDPRATPSNPSSAKRMTVFDQFTAYKNRGRGAWLRVNDSVVKRSVFADLPIGATYASGNAGVSDSLFVGESANKGAPSQWEAKGPDGRSLPFPWEATFPIRGFEYYDGPVFATRSHFAGFTPRTQRQASALSTLRFTAFPMNPQNWSSSLSFGDGVNRVHAENRPAPKPKESENGYRTAVFFDRDGSVTGNARHYVVMNSPLLLSDRCRAVAAWNASVCNDSFVAASFWTGAGDHPGSVTLRRDDGATHLMNWAATTSTRTFPPTAATTCRSPVTCPRRCRSCCRG